MCPRLQLPSLCTHLCPSRASAAAHCTGRPVHAVSSPALVQRTCASAVVQLLVLCEAATNQPRTQSGEATSSRTGNHINHSGAARKRVAPVQHPGSSAEPTATTFARVSHTRASYRADSQQRSRRHQFATLRQTRRSPRSQGNQAEAAATGLGYQIQPLRCDQSSFRGATHQHGPQGRHNHSTILRSRAHQGS